MEIYLSKKKATYLLSKERRWEMDLAQKVSDVNINQI